MTVPAFPMARAARCPFDPPPAGIELMKQGPLARVRLWDGSTPWLVTRFDEQRALLADPRVSADITRPGYPSPAPVQPGGSGIGFILMDDPDHARLRRMVTAPFSVKRVRAMAPAVQQIVDDLVDDLLAEPNPVDLVEAFALPVPSLVICELLGVPYTDHEFFQDHSRTIIRRDAAPEERSAASAGLVNYLDGLMGDKLARPGDELLSGLAERVTAGELSRMDAAQMGVLLLIAGHETTANMIALGTLALLQHPDQLALLREGDDGPLASAVEELLRYLNITHNGRRRVALEDIEIGGTVIRAGEGIILANDLGNRDPSVFPDGDRLDITRNARRHVAFGFGVHQCLGQQLARLELQIVYGTLYRRVPTLALAAGIEDIPFKHDGSVYGVYELPVTW
ncbi:cytochrome P450 [Amycolatopsis thermalba]|uniref:cytochrome P450 n=1 Tax=Amycolatopsis thermalba TaxID=944492 RepID=UPI000E287A65|nr:cytochrome P450 [Amycolatopsis thermalba]